MEKFNYAICTNWQKKNGKTIVPNKDVQQGTFEELAYRIKILSQRVIYNKKDLPILFTTSRKVSKTENFTFQTEEKFIGDHELLCLDYESNELTRRQAENQIKKMDLRYIAHNTYSHGVCKEKKFRYRIIIPLNRAYKSHEFKLIKPELKELFSFKKEGLDDASFKQNSFMFLAAIYEGKRKPKITEHTGKCLTLEKILQKKQQEEEKRKAKKKEIVLTGDSELNTDRQKAELENVHQLLSNREKGKTNDYLVKGVNRLKYAGFDDQTIINELSQYETREHKNKVAKHLLPNHKVQQIETKPYFYRYENKFRLGRNWRYDNQLKLFYNDVKDTWVKYPRLSQDQCKEEITINEFEVAGFEYLKDVIGDKALTEKTMVLLHFIYRTNKIVDKIIARNLKNKISCENFYYRLGNKKFRKGVYFSKELLVPFQKKITFAKKLEVDMLLPIPVLPKEAKDIKLLDWLTSETNSILYNSGLLKRHKKLTKIKTPNGKNYFSWVQFLFYTNKLKKSKHKKYTITTNSAVQLFKKMEIKLKFLSIDKHTITQNNFIKKLPK